MPPPPAPSLALGVGEAGCAGESKPQAEMKEGAFLSGDFQYLHTATQTSPKPLLLSPVTFQVEDWPGLTPWASAPGEIPEQLRGGSRGLFLTRDTL